MTKRNDPELIRLQQENERQHEQIAQLTQLASTLQEQLRESFEGNAELRKQLSSLQSRLDELLFQLQNLNREKFGETSEHHNPRQAFGQSGTETEPEEQEADNSAANRLKKRATAEKRPRNHKKHIKNQDLPSKDVKHKVVESDLVCPECNVGKTFVKFVETSQIERLISSLVKLNHLQEVWACPKCKGHVSTAEKPESPIPGGYAGPCLLSSIIVDKFAFALPNYRQTKRFTLENAIIPRSTQCDWMIACSLTLEPLYELLKKEVLSSKVVGTDDSWVKIQDRGLKKKMRKGKMTSYVGDRRHPLIFFDFAPNLSFDQNKKTLKHFKGFVQADAATGFDALFKEDSGRTEIGCNAHSRRKYWQCAQDDAYELVCGEILDIYHKLYKVEQDVRDKEPDQRLEARQQVSKGLTETLKEKLLSLKDTLPPTNPLMKAVAYTLTHWDALVRFLDDPDFEIDNNACERSIKSWVLVRKNVMFVGSDAGGRAAAIHLSFISSCVRNGIDPVKYFADVLARINSMTTGQLHQILPDRWTQERNCKPPP
jgi:transposase